MQYCPIRSDSFGLLMSSPTRTILLLSLAIGCTAFGQETAKLPPTPLVVADPASLSAGTERLDLYLLIGQSNMKGRGHVPEIPKNDERILMMHLRDDQWYHARHPLHLTGNATTFEGQDNAGVGPGLTFAEAMQTADPKARIGLIPCAKGGSAIRLWGKGERLYTKAIRRTQLALSQGPVGKTRLRGVLWLQGEADAKEGATEAYAAALHDLVDRLRSDLGDPALPFIACTIGEMRPTTQKWLPTKINAILLDLPKLRPATACVDARDLRGHIGDDLHFDSATQEEIGRRYAAALLQLTP